MFSSLNLRMMENLIAKKWQDYELIDAGDGLRLERFGPYTFVRPDSNVLWQKTTPTHPAWAQPDGKFLGREEKESWQLASLVLKEGWELRWGKLKVKVKPTPFRHMGIFPEQAAHWQWLQHIIGSAKTPVKVLNLFAYTGASSIVAAQAGAHVTHVDASKGTVYWASENAQLSGLGKESIRWIVDDVVKFLHREVRRGAKYDVILMDPPVFGRGPKGEVWRLEDGLSELVQLASQLLSPDALGVLVNFYATDIYPQSIERLVNQLLQKQVGKLNLYSVCLEEESSKKPFPTGYCLRS